MRTALAVAVRAAVGNIGNHGHGWRCDGWGVGVIGVDGGEAGMVCWEA